MIQIFSYSAGRRRAPRSFLWLIDNNGNTVVEYYYDAWGNHKVVDEKGDEITDQDDIGNLNPFRYRGYYYDTETGLYFLQTRYYAPEVGRFLNRDSVQYADPETINGLNLYAYCLNNPVEYADPTGNEEIPWWGKLLIGIGFIVVGAAVTALTAGTGVGFLSAFGSALLSSTIQVGISTGISSVISGTLSAINGNGFLSGFTEGLVDGFMWGGIFAGGSQILSAGFKGLAKLGVATGKNGGIANSGLFSPNRLKNAAEIAKIAQKGQKFYDYGGTIFKIGKYLHLDVSTKSFLHLHLWFTAAHLPLGTILAGIIGGL